MTPVTSPPRSAGIIPLLDYKKVIACLGLIITRLQGVGDRSGFEILHLYVTYLGIHHILRQCKCMCVDFQKAWFIKAESWLETRIVERCELSVTAECI